MTFTIGSLFDGSGGFPLAAFMCGGVPVWASEIEPYPIAVTKSRFPYMKHLGDISKLHGAQLEPVDLITFGSPCQDLSVAGKRAGLKHETNGDEETTRSGLFMEAVRIIKEMREATDGKYPRFALWENVPGAFSSNRGEDFRIVLEEIAKISEADALMPEVPKSGWAYADCYSGDGWSMAYRVLDAQHWGVPQRRRRIFLVADFAGERAEEILFERKGLRGYFEEGRTPWQGATAYAESCAGAEDSKGAEVYESYPADSRVRLIETAAPTLTAKYAKLGVDGTIVCMATQQGGAEIRTDDKAPTITAAAGMSGNNQPVLIYDSRGNGDGETANTITGDHESRITDYSSVVVEPVVFDGAGITSPINASNPRPGDPCHTLSSDSRNLLVEPVFCLQGNDIDRADTAGCNGKGWKKDICYTLNTIDRPAVALSLLGDEVAGTLKARDYKGVGRQDSLGSAVCLAYGLDRASFNQGENAKYDFSVLLEQQPTLTARGPGAVCNEYIVRRLTPTECARLQGFADDWGQIDKKESFTEEEYRFWHDVRNTYAAINGKQVKDYTEKQMLNWYNKLHTDSAEYKMWGNGIALPNALYVMQGIAEVFGH